MVRLPSPHSHPICPTPRVFVVQSKSRYELKDEDKHEALDQELTDGGVRLAWPTCLLPGSCRRLALPRVPRVVSPTARAHASPSLLQLQ